MAHSVNRVKGLRAGFAARPARTYLHVGKRVS